MSKLMYNGEEILGGGGIEEYDTDNGWHVRKWSNGYFEMFLTQDVDIPSSNWIAWGNIFSVPIDKTPRIMYPLSVVSKYIENVNIVYPIDGAIGIIYGPQYQNKTQAIGFIRGTVQSTNITVKIRYQICGTWST